jgi:hypothetical protein
MVICTWLLHGNLLVCPDNLLGVAQIIVSLNRVGLLRLVFTVKN